MVINLSNKRRVLLGKYLGYKRRESGLVQKDMAALLGYKSNQYLSNIERGKCEPSMDCLIVMIEAYKIPREGLYAMLSDWYMNELREALGLPVKRKRGGL